MRKPTFLLLTLILLLTACQPAATPAAEPSPTLPPATPTPGPLASDGVPNESYYAPFPLTVALDGAPSEWALVPQVTMPEAGPSIQGSTWLSFAAAADDAYLYFLADVHDPKIITGQHGSDYWNEDSVEFYLNATGDLTLKAYEDAVVQITVPPLNAGKSPDEVVLGGVNHENANARAAVALTDYGYVVEVAVPLQNDFWNIQPVHGGVLGFQVHLNGASQSSRDKKVIWSRFDLSDSSYYDPSVFGKLVFFEIGQTDVTEILPTPTPKTAGPTPPADALYRQADADIEARVEDLLARMTLTEKIGQMTLVEKGSINPADIAPLGIGGLLSGGGGYPREGNTPENWAAMVDGFQQEALNSRLGIPLIYGVDAVHGHNNVYGATIFPHNIGLGAANDPDLMTRIGRAVAQEMAATGIYWNYAPAVMVPQDIRWGRTYEGFSEDPALVSALAAAYLQGLQSPDLFAENMVIGTPKHFLGDGGTVWGTGDSGYKIDQGDAQVDEATLRALHLPPYQAVVQSGARSIMISYSSWNGEKMHASKYWISGVLKGELGFTGFVVSDWGAIDQISPDYYQAVVTAINAGVDMNMVPYEYERFITTLTQAVEAGDVPMERIDDAVRRILRVKFEMGLFEQPFSQPDLLASVGSDAHRALAREAVAKSLVLLKNEGGLLPLAKDAPALYIGGRAADDIGIQSGGWTIEWQGKVGDITPGTTILEGIQAAVSADTVVEYNEHGRFEGDPSAPGAVCIAVVGETPYAEGKGDSANLRISGTDNRVLRRMEADCANLVVVLISGRPLMITDDLPKWDALVAAWLPGSEGAGVADVLFGDQPFQGKLPFTWPASLDQLPLGAGSGQPFFPFGYGE
ncbi:MAG: hypothetical protein Fur0018_27950 [Anaerolineales bacterium]